MGAVKKQELGKKGLTYPGYWLHYWEEAIGPLEKVWKENGSLGAKIGKIIQILPVEMETKLRPLIGMRVGILKTDILGKEWLFRVITDSGQKTESMTARDHCCSEAI